MIITPCVCVCVRVRIHMKRAHEEESSSTASASASATAAVAATPDGMRFLRDVVNTVGATLTDTEAMPDDRIDFVLSLPSVRSGLTLRFSYEGVLNQRDLNLVGTPWLVLAITDRIQKQAVKEGFTDARSTGPTDVLHAISEAAIGIDQSRPRAMPYVLAAAAVLWRRLEETAPTLGVAQTLDVLVLCDRGRERSFFLVALLYLAFDAIVNEHAETRRRAIAASLTRRMEKDMPKSMRLLVVRERLKEFAGKMPFDPPIEPRERPAKLPRTTLEARDTVIVGGVAGRRRRDRRSGVAAAPAELIIAALGVAMCIIAAFVIVFSVTRH